jgi:hypothetical protein
VRVPPQPVPRAGAALTGCIAGTGPLLVGGRRGRGAGPPD